MSFPLPRPQPRRILLAVADEGAAGPLRRALRIAGALASGPPRVRVAVVAERGAGVSSPVAGVEVHAPRLDAVAAFAPDMAVIEGETEGRLAGPPGLLPLLAEASCRCVLGLRDVLGPPEAVSRAWRDLRFLDTVRERFEAVWVFGDPTVYAAADAYGFPGWLRDRLSYTGYIDVDARPDAGTTAPVEDGAAPGVSCVVGRRGAEGLAETVTEAAQVVGTSSSVTAEPSEARRARRVVATADYDTVWDLLALGLRPLLVTHGGEERVRAQRLADLGLADWIPHAEVTVAAVAAWLDASPDAGPDARRRVDFDGLRRIAAFAGDLGVPGPPPTQAPVAPPRPCFLPEPFRRVLPTGRR